MRRLTQLFRRSLDCLQLFPTGIELDEIFLRGGEVVGELIGLGGMRAVKIRLGEQTFDAGDFRVHGVDLCLHAFQFAHFLEGKFAGLRGFCGRAS